MDHGLAKLITAAMVMLLLVPAYMALRRDRKTETRNLLIWAIILAVLALGWHAFH